MAWTLPLSAAALLTVGCSNGPGPLSRSAFSSAQTEEVPAEAASSDVVMRRLWSHDYNHPGWPEGGTAISPDGRFLLIADWEQAEGDLAAMDLTTGDRRRVTYANVGGRGSVYAYNALISRDGERLAFVRIPEGVDDHELHVAELRDASRSKMLLRRDEVVDYFEPFDWSPDGTQLLVLIYGSDESARLATVGTADGAVGVLESFGWRSPFSARFSPDGRSVAYAARTRDDAVDQDLFVLAADGSSERRLTEDGGQKSVLGWSEAGDALFYSVRGRNGLTAVWRLPLSAGRRAGTPQLVRSDLWGFRPIRLVRDKLYYDVGGTRQQPQMFEAVAAPEGEGATSRPWELTDRRAGGRPMWSPDGTQIAYEVPGDPSLFVIRSVATGEERELVPGVRSATARFWWSRDGQALILMGSRRGRAGTYRYDLRSGALSLLADERALAIGPDASILYLRAEAGLQAYDPESGERRLVIDAGEISTFTPLTHVEVSPDGSQIAMRTNRTGRRSITVWPSSGGESRDVFTLEAGVPGGLNDVVTWSPDGRNLVFTTSHPNPNRTAGSPPSPLRKIQMVPAAGGAVQTLATVDGMALGISDVRIHPDGRRLLFTGGGDPNRTVEIWVMENLSPGAQTGARRP